jgi:hypothetical protein
MQPKKKKLIIIITSTPVSKPKERSIIGISLSYDFGIETTEIFKFLSLIL